MTRKDETFPMPKYMAEVIKLRQLILPGELAEVVVVHDSWCPLLYGRGGCSCNPEVRVEAIHGRPVVSS